MLVNMQIILIVLINMQNILINMLIILICKIITGRQRGAFCARLPLSLFYKMATSALNLNMLEHGGP